MLIEIKDFLELVETASNWLDRAVSGQRDRRIQSDAHILRDAGVVVSAMRAHDNTLTRLLGRLELFDESWSDEDRRRAAEEARQFFTEEHILPALRQSLRSLVLLIGALAWGYLVTDVNIPDALLERVWDLLDDIVFVLIALSGLYWLYWLYRVVSTRSTRDPHR